MKTLPWTLIILMTVLLACKKESIKKSDEDLQSVQLCVKSDFQDVNDVPSGVTQYIYEPLKTDAKCGCIVAGKVKYVKQGKTTALVDYGNGACDKWAVQTNCYNGDCKHKKATKCKFEQKCKPST